MNELKGAEAGKALEHYIFTELTAYLGLSDLDYRINYWRTKTGLEVDFIISKIRGKTIPIEVKISSNIHNSELRGIKSFIEEHSLSKGYVVCLEERLRKIVWGTQEIDIILVQEFLEKLWNHEIL